MLNSSREKRGGEGEERKRGTSRRYKLSKTRARLVLLATFGSSTSTSNFGSSSSSFLLLCKSHVRARRCVMMTLVRAAQGSSHSCLLPAEFAVASEQVRA